MENRNDPEAQDDGRTRQQRPSTLQWKPDKEEKQQEDKKEEQGWEPERSSRSQGASSRPPEKVHRLSDQSINQLINTGAFRWDLQQLNTFCYIPTLLLVPFSCPARKRKRGRHTARQSSCRRTPDCSTPAANQQTGLHTWQQGR